jgi:monofunctional biosynthetic peptidoglycan transglycosylase
VGVLLLWLSVPDPTSLRRENPRTTALLEQRRTEAKARRHPFHPRQEWVRLEAISASLVDAVIASEDANFFSHDGVDWAAVRAAADHDLKVRRFARGASTITQQLAKNLWLGTKKSLWRKAEEAVLATKLERALSKRRILALYLNVVELDEGVFGVEAGARHRFGVSAARLSTAQSVVLASLLPAPRRVDLARPSAWLKSRSRRLLDRLRDAGRIDAAEHLAASAELERILAGPAPAHDEGEPPEDEAEGTGAEDVSAATPSTAITPAGPSPDTAPAPLPAAATPDEGERTR